MLQATLEVELSWNLPRGASRSWTVGGPVRLLGYWPGSLGPEKNYIDQD